MRFLAPSRPTTSRLGAHRQRRMLQRDSYGHGLFQQPASAIKRYLSRRAVLPGAVAFADVVDGWTIALRSLRRDRDRIGLSRQVKMERTMASDPDQSIATPE